MYIFIVLTQVRHPDVLLAVITKIRFVLVSAHDEHRNKEAEKK